MNFAFSQLHINKRHIRQSFLTLLLFCATLFVHSEHYAQVELDGISNFELHDCHLCQQGIDSPPRALALYPASAGIVNISKVDIINAVFISATYVYPPLRAPPMFL
ncbi:hypothetical protein CXF85_06930 [Colwellia sp. 75C3]|nr:hypothetical protein CXF85_06930 [Colwellia sp. 75C3]